MTHGTITNKNTGDQLKGEYRNGVDGSMFDFRIDGTTMANTFVSREWAFEADKPKPPTKPGIWLYSSYGLDKDGDLSSFPNIILHLSGGWYSIGNHNGMKTHMPAEEVARLFGRDRPPVPLTLKQA